MEHYAKKVAICYYNGTKTVLRRNHIKVITKEVELCSLEPKDKIRKNYKRPLFNRV